MTIVLSTVESLHITSHCGGLDGGLAELRHRPDLAYADEDFGQLIAVTSLPRLTFTRNCSTRLALDWPGAIDSERPGLVNVWYWLHDLCSDLPGYLRDLRIARRLAETATAQNRARGLPGMSVATGIRLQSHGIFYAQHYLNSPAHRSVGLSTAGSERAPGSRLR